jgi:TRAP-type mannitol/chloroaromatic compound transport system substrate-binding protein
LVLLLLAGCGDGGTASSGAAAEGGAAVDPAKVFRWKLITTWPKNLPGLGMAPERLAERLRAMSNGRLDITVYGAGELVGAFEVFDAVSQGTAQMGHGAAYYWRGKIPVAAMFTTVPFGMTAQEMNAWLQYGGGLALWRELYAPFDLLPMAAGNTGVQMAGWFNKEINSVADIAGLKMRIPGLGGEVMQRAGATQVTVPASEIFTALQTGAIDAAEWVGPYNDLSLGLHKAARYYYYPGWHEPGPLIECIVNKEAWDSLPEDLQEIVSTTCQAINLDTQAEYNYGNAQALHELMKIPGVELREFPKDVLDLLRKHSYEVIDELSARDPAAKRLQESVMAFMEKSSVNQKVSELSYLKARIP